MEIQFEHQPFNVTPDPAMVYLAAGFQEAQESILAALEAGKGFIVVTGEVGAGKTTLLRTILSAPHPAFETAVILNTGLGPDDLLRAVARDLGAALPTDGGRSALVAAIEEKLLATFSAGKSTLVFIDEAQHLSDESLECLRMLSNLETESDKLIQIALFGQNELRENLARPELRQLSSRIAVHRHLEPLTREETAHYVQHRIAQANPNYPVSFEEPAISALHRSSRGLPRRINLIADQALQMTLRSGFSSVPKSAVKAAAKDLTTLEPAGGLSWKNLSRHLPTAAAWLLLAVMFVYVVRRLDTPRSVSRTAAVTPVTAAPATGASDAGQRPRRTGAGELLRRFFVESGHTPPDFPDRLEAVKAENLAASIGLRWVEIPANAELLSKIGLPTFAFVTTIEREQKIALVVPTPGDTEAVTVEVEGDAPVSADWKTLALAPLPAAVVIPVNTWTGRLLTHGASGPDVVSLQNMLRSAGYLSAQPNGHYGPSTWRAVLRFQSDRGIPEDGVAGPLTFTSLYSAAQAADAARPRPANPATR
jgi:type II secretory pathway predicted ATPase ExeA